jgi:ABC-type multidrug transport system fused ATPase/permease subunit
MGSRAILASQRNALAAIVALTLVGTASEAGFLVIVARAGVALANGEAAIALHSDRAMSMTTGLAFAAVFISIRLAAAIVAAGLTSRSLARVAVDIRSVFTDSYLSTSWDLKHGLAPGRVQQLLSAYTQTSVNVVTAAARGLTAMASLAALSMVAFVIQPYITLATAVLGGLLSVAMVPLRRRVKETSERAATAQLDFGTRVNEMESLALELEVHGVREAAAERVHRAAVEAAVSNRRSLFAQLAIGPTYQTIAYGGVVSLLAVGVSTGVDDIGTVGAVLLLLLRCLGYGQSLQVARAQYIQSDVYGVALDAEVRRYQAAVPTPGTTTGLSRSGLAACDLEFSYDPETPTLRGLTFDIPAGTIVGIVGPSGSGKSTLTQLILGLRTSDGALTLDGVPIDDADPTWWSSQVALVPQQSQLLTGSIADNVRFLRPHIDAADIETACRQAAIHDEIMTMGGYDAPVGERGGALSGGQRQRLCIARALAGRPSLLVLDEPTSALDSTSERRVLDTLAERRGETTVVIVTHRLAVLEVCDQVLALDEGRVAYLGPTAGYELAHPGRIIGDSA